MKQFATDTLCVVVKVTTETEIQMPIKLFSDPQIFHGETSRS